MSSKLVVMKDGDGWGLFRREWEGVGKPDYFWVQNLTFEAAVELVKGGTTDLFGHVEEALKNPLDELAKLGRKPS